MYDDTTKGYNATHTRTGTHIHSYDIDTIMCQKQQQTATMYAEMRRCNTIHFHCIIYYFVVFAGKNKKLNQQMFLSLETVICWHTFTIFSLFIFNGFIFSFR